MKFAICGQAGSAYGAIIYKALRGAGLTPSICFLRDDNLKHQALGRAMLFANAASFDASCETRYIGQAERDADIYCLAAHDQVPCVALPEFTDPIIVNFLTQMPVDIIVNLDAPPLKGPILYQAPFGILSIHAADLPHYRGNDATALNIYNNTPLFTSAFILTPWLDEGCIIDKRRIPVHDNDNMTEINARALKIGAELYCAVLKDLKVGKIRFFRQNEWEGQTFRRSGSAGHLERAIDGRYFAAVEERLSRKYSYAYVSPVED